MRPSIPKLKFFLANDALIHFFKNRYWFADELNSARSFCQIHNSTNIWNLKLRLLCEENNDMIVASVLADSSSEILSFLNQLKRKLSDFQDLLFALKQFSLSSSDKLAYKVIRNKILNPNQRLSTAIRKKIFTMTFVYVIHNGDIFCNFRDYFNTRFFIPAKGSTLSSSNNFFTAFSFHPVAF